MATPPDPVEPAVPPPSGAPAPPRLAERRVHFIGVGGSGMSGLAHIAQHHGAACSGSDRAESETLGRLRAAGVAVHAGDTAALPPDAELVVYSAAIPSDHPELAEARRRGLAVMKYAELLGALMLGRTGVAVAGTHGKSSTTSMLSHVLIATGLDPSLIVGAHCAQIGGGARCGAGPLLVAEACEFDRSFHHFHPTHAVILNIEADHLDVFGSLDAVLEAFAVFARRLPPAEAGGTLLIQHELPQRLAVCAGLGCRVETLGFAPDADWCVDAEGPAVTLRRDGRPVASWTSPLPGDHMAYNAAAAAVTAHRLGAPWGGIAAALESFAGLDRRMQRLGRRPVPGGHAEVVDDYAHHPSEIDATLRALRHHDKPGRVLCVFQPHQHSRTRLLMHQFAASFGHADWVLVPEIYFVRDSEQERHKVSADDLVAAIRARGGRAEHLDPMDAIVDRLAALAQPGDLIVTMGAGDVWKVARAFLARSPEALRARE